MKKIILFLFAVLCAALSFAKPVVVGLVDACRTNTLCGVGNEYAAVYESGVVPYVLPATTNAASIAALLDRVDMLIFCGGEDGKINPRRNAWESAIANEATRRHIPAFGTNRQDLPPFSSAAILAIDPAKRTATPRRKLIAIPDYCPTNRQVVAKANMVAALEQAGFVSVVIPFTDDNTRLEAALADADALMVAGGLGPLQDYKKRCAFEHRAIRIALKRGIPISGVCHGSQIINTFFGGTLKLTPQMTNKKKKPLIRHRMPVTVPYVDNFHLADLEPGSRIARVLGSNRAVINSSHSNRSFEMGKGLKVTARAPDGVVEAFEHESLPIMAFQFHPERMAFDARFIELLRVSLSPISK